LLGGWEVGRLGGWEAGRLGGQEAGRLGEWEAGRLEDWEAQTATSVADLGSSFKAMGPTLWETTHRRRVQYLYNVNSSGVHSLLPTTHRMPGLASDMGFGAREETTPLCRYFTDR
jgi:hypothetical protein